MGKIADATKYENQFKELWETKDTEVKKEWLVSEGFNEGKEYATKHWDELKRAMRQRWRTLLNEYVRNVRRHKGRWTSMSKYDQSYYVVGGDKTVHNRKKKTIGGQSKYTVGGSKLAL